MNKLSHDEYITQLNSQGIMVKPLEEYQGRKKKILHQCVCGNKWLIAPNNVLAGQSCPICKKDKLRQFHLKGHKDYLEQLSQRNINIVPLETYVSSKVKISHMCSKGHIFEATPSNVLQGNVKCPICRYIKVGQRNSLNTEIFLSKNADKINNTIQIIGEYVNSKTPIKCKCLLCGQEYETTPNSLRLGSGCPKCAKERICGSNRLTEEEFYKKYSATMNKNIRILGKYKSMNEPVECECLICGKKYSTIPYRIAEGMGCKDCAKKENGLKLRKTTEEFIKEVKDITPSIKILGRYKTSLTPIKCECLICGHVWSPVAGTLVSQKVGCPICAASHGEKRICVYLQENGIVYNSQQTFDGLLGTSNGLLSYDFYLPTYNLLIEYQGSQHESPKGGIFGGEEQFEIQQEHDRRKREYAKSHNMNLLEIWYYDYDNIEQILTEYLNLNSESVETVTDV